MNILTISKTTLLAAAIVTSPIAFSDSTYNSDVSTTDATREMERTNIESSNSESKPGVQEHTKSKHYYSTETTTVGQQKDKMASQQDEGMTETVAFEQDSVTLSDDAEQTLDQLAQGLEKNVPTELTVEVATTNTAAETQGRSSESSMEQQSNMNDRSNVDGNLADSSPSTQSMNNDALATRNEDVKVYDNSDVEEHQTSLQNEIQQNAQIITQHRAERVKQALEDRGIEVSELKVKDAQEPASLDEEAMETQSDISAGSNVQKVRIVITDDLNRDGLSVL